MASARTPKNKPPIQDLSQLKAELRAHGLKSTAPRLAVLAELQRATSPKSHAEIFEAVEGQGLDRATVYRNLIDLAEKRIVTRSDLGDHVWRFELRRAAQKGKSHGAEHPHFVCTDCGDVACLPAIAVRVVGGEGAPKSVAAKAIEVQIKGLCDDCAS